jgi:hypothetical protein
MLLSACDSAVSTTTTTTFAGATTTAPSGTTTASPGPGGDGCRVTVSGDDDRTWSAPDDGEAFATDYWRTEEELRAQYEVLAIQGDPTFEEIQTEGLAVFSFFSMTCAGEDGDMVAIFVSGATTRDDMPMAPGVYPISGGLFGAGDLPAGEMSASYMPAEASTWGEEGEGTLAIEVWDGSQIRGTFTFIAEERFVSDPRVVEVSGTFEFVSGG